MLFRRPGASPVSIRVAHDADATVEDVLNAAQASLDAAIREEETSITEENTNGHIGNDSNRRDGSRDTAVFDAYLATLSSETRDALGRDAAALFADVPANLRGVSPTDAPAFAFAVSPAGALVHAANDVAGVRTRARFVAEHLSAAMAGFLSANPASRRRAARAVRVITPFELDEIRARNAASARPAYLPTRTRTVPGDGSYSIEDTNGRAWTLHARFLATTAADPDAPAVALERDAPLTRRQLFARAYAIARRLEATVTTVGDDSHSTRIEPADGSYSDVPGEANFVPSSLPLRGRTVGVYLERGPDLLAALLATHLAGAAYVPLDPVYPVERVGGMLADADVAAVITSRRDGLVERVDGAARFADRAAEEGTRIPIVLTDDEPTTRLARSVVDAGDAALDAALDSVALGVPSDVAYVIFTSGSTGRPKGVRVTHRNLVNFLASVEELTSADERLRLCAVTTVCFDIAALELFLPMWTGGVALLARRETASDPEALGDVLVDVGANLMQATPTTWRMLLRAERERERQRQRERGRDGSYSADGSDRGRRSALRGLDALVGGEALPADVAEGLLDATRRAFNVYGPTETTVWSTAAEISRPDVCSVGVPLANATAHVLAVVEGEDGVELVPAPVGVAGEICLGGAGVSLGYLGRDDLTADRFLPDPFAVGEYSSHSDSVSNSDPHAPLPRLYRTGDLGRVRPDGRLECLGRLDHQVKIRGYRVELGEIETALAALASVETAVVVAADAAEGESDAKQLIAYVLEAETTAEKTAVEDAVDTPKKKTNENAVDDDLAEARAWGAVYDEAYAARDALDESDPSLNFSGYLDSYAPGRVHHPETVREWVETICDRVASLRPRRALELGCGNGMILLRVAETCERYVGTDLSPVAVDYVRGVVETHPRYSGLATKCRLDIAGAHEAGRFVDERLDAVVCNGVSMYFPSAEYLLSVVRASLEALDDAERGHFFLGDVRNLRAHAHFHASVQAHVASPETSFDAFRVAAAAGVTHEKEFLVDPAAFLAVFRHALPRHLCDRVSIDMRRGYRRSEFGLFRYDVVFRRPKRGDDGDEDGRDERGDGRGDFLGARYRLIPYDPAKHTLARLETILEKSARSDGSGRSESSRDEHEDEDEDEREDERFSSYFALRDVPDARLVRDAILLAETEHPSEPFADVAHLRAFVDDRAMALERDALEPEDLYRLGERLGYVVNAMWAPDAPERFDVVFAKKSAPEPEPIVFASARCRGVDAPAIGRDGEGLRELTNKGEKATTRARERLEDARRRARGMDGSGTEVSADDTAGDVPATSGGPPRYALMPASRARGVREALRARLPAYMIPRAVVVASAAAGGFPMTANGKVDRAKLPHPATLSSGRRNDASADDGRVGSYVAPDGEVEEMVAAAFEETLAPEGGLAVGATDDFFDLGGHSLLAMQLVGRVEAATGTRLQMRHLTESPTPRARAARLETARDAAANTRVSERASDERVSDKRAAAGGGGGYSDDARRDPGSNKPGIKRRESSRRLTVVDPGTLPHGVTRVDEVFFSTRDGCRLSARLWLPDGVRLDPGEDGARAPAVLEILPYGVHFGTVDVDEATYPYLAGNGIACVRVDARGSGNSEGVLDDEYSHQQQRDACDAVEWAAAQGWCTGAVGLMGCSWGGFVALQVAALAGETAKAHVAVEAPSLRAVCAVCATDDRASDDMHWMGGSLLGENLAWGAWLLDSLAAPPVPLSDAPAADASTRGTTPAVSAPGSEAADQSDDERVDVDDWESRWVDRLEELKPMHGSWASLHPGTEEGEAYWREGSVGNHLSDIAVPVLSVGCLHGGGYANATPRLARALGGAGVKAVMGSWVHNYPHLSRSGPAFGFLAEVLAFWRAHLGVPGASLPSREDVEEAAAGQRALPGVRVHVVKPPTEGPVTVAERADGYWIAEPSQRDLDVAASDGALRFAFEHKGTLVPIPEDAARGRVEAEEGAEPANRAAPASFESTLGSNLGAFANGASLPAMDTPDDPVGVASGRWFTFGDGDDLPGDQRPDDAKSVCFDAAPVESERALVGAPRVVVACRRRASADEASDSNVHRDHPERESSSEDESSPPSTFVVVARVCAVAPDGASHRVTYGVVNVVVPRGERNDAFRAVVTCDYCAFSLPAGWRLRVAVSQTYWPVVAPSPRAFEPLDVIGGALDVPSLTSEHVADRWSFTAAAAIPELEVLVAPLATKGLRGGEVRNAIEDGLPGGGADAIRVVDAGARLIPTRHGDGTPPLVVESGWTEVSGKKDRTQRVERRRVIRGIDPSAAVAPGSPTRSNSPGPGGLVDAEIAVTADMTVVPESGEYRFDTKLEAFVLGGEDDSADESHGDPVRKRVVFRRRWTEVAPAKLGIAAKHMSAAA